jgi:DNA (cytosine-5)-methyltransferase 1
MKFLDLFSGIGGFRLGMEMNGHECVGHCEIDKYADKSYRAMHDVKENEYYANDIRGIIPSELPDFDCICGGFPCQSFSIAGKRGGFEDTRGTLFFEIARIIQERKPRLVFLENVAGLLSHDDGSTFETIIGTLDELGYDVEWQVCNSKDFGVPQNRERVFIIGHIRGSCRRTVFPIKPKGGGTIKIVGTTKLNPDAIGSKDMVYSVEGIMGCMRASDYKQPKQILSDSGQGRKWREQSQFSALRVGGDVQCIKLLGNVNPSGNGMNGNVFSSDGLAPCISTNKGEGSKIAIPVLTPDRP